ncbi:MAG: hypothetical protein N5P05_000782 [Chroococcopsis gigantea SAG 12.99]|jgi:uncharacterized protein YjbI with pentapeptide repeats|nr:pentapeptide repeat-containing protein [Chlorogloea purpurea SAG 13.99]MDV2999176.1 hypothetical protein [Chroococcopsis gigantea SAG 12.99]
MFQNSTAIELRQKYEAGERDFTNLQQRRGDLRGLNLSGANLKGADLSYANLRDVDLSNADLRGVYFNEADLSGANLAGANLQGASLIKAYLIKANLSSANLQAAYFTGAYLTKANLTDADLTGTYLNGAQLTGANLTGAHYTSCTHFDPGFNVQKFQLKKEYGQGQEVGKITWQELLDSFNHLSEISSRYLGSTMTVKNWESTKPPGEISREVTINKKAQFTGDKPQQVLTDLQKQQAKVWVQSFVKCCSAIVQDFPNLIDTKQMVFPLTEAEKDLPIIVQKKANPGNQLQLSTIFS